MKQFSLLDLLRVWAAITGMLLTLGFFGALLVGITGPVTTMLPMLVAAIGGFELFLFAQDLWLKRSGSRG